MKTTHGRLAVSLRSPTNINDHTENLGFVPHPGLQLRCVPLPYIQQHLFSPELIADILAAGKKK
jgi:hypothetical protein